jgi:hypothetical protein
VHLDPRPCWERAVVRYVRRAASTGANRARERVYALLLSSHRFYCYFMFVLRIAMLKFLSFSFQKKVNTNVFVFYSLKHVVYVCCCLYMNAFIHSCSHINQESAINQSLPDHFDFFAHTRHSDQTPSWQHSH